MHHLNTQWLTPALLVLLTLSGCDNDPRRGFPRPSPEPTDNSATVTKSTTGTVAAVVGGGAQTLSITFNASDAKPLSDLSVTAGLSSLPLGWTGPSVFTCATVTTGSGCVLNLSYAPNAIGSGTLELSYQYVNDAKTTKTGTIAIPFAATTTNNVVATAAPSGQIQAIAGSGTQSLHLTFTTDDGNPAHQLQLTSALTSLPSGWTSNVSTFTCATVSTGNGCQLGLVYEPSSADAGTLTFEYSYEDNSGTAKTGTVSVPYAGTSQNNLVGTVSPTGQIAAVVGGSQPVDITFTSDDGRTITGISVTSDLSALPTGWSASAPSFTCASASTGNGCQLHLTYAPSVVASSTLSLNYAYTDNSGGAKSGSINVPFVATVDNNVVATVSPTGQVIVPISASKNVDITFTSDDGHPATSFAIANLSALPAGWSGPSSFSCATVSTGNACQLAFAYAPTAATTGTLTLSYSYINHAGVTKNGSVNINYVGHQQHVFAADGGRTLSCPVHSDGGVGACVLAGAPALLVYGTIARGDRLYVADQATGQLRFCEIQANATLDYCDPNGSPMGIFNTTRWLTIAGDLLYAAGTSDVLQCEIDPDGRVSNCTSAMAGDFGGIVVTASRAYIAQPSTNQIAVCDLLPSGSIGACQTAGIGLSMPTGIALSADETQLYVANTIGNSVSRCTLGADGLPSACVTEATQLGAWSIALNGQYAYIGSIGGGLLKCSLAGDGSLSNCTTTATGGQPYSGYQMIVH
ncbi:hypothetical protein [Steroidobacter cummioxidans]|uniref:hypothetical protein n=1 Tax=Steroidobacter cummioxidans TaxID=1803913 RepID=UPI000E30C227|nr:hypothetical protein [Steroidobacter cummioxidans]